MTPSTSCESSQWESERATTLEAVADGAADTVQVTEHAGGTGDIACSQEFAHP